MPSQHERPYKYGEPCARRHHSNKDKHYQWTPIEEDSGRAERITPQGEAEEGQDLEEESKQAVSLIVQAHCCGADNIRYQKEPDKFATATITT